MGNLKPDTFDGSTPVEEWLETLEDCASVNGIIDDDVKLAVFARSFVRGQVRTFVHSIPSERKKSYLKLKEDLTLEYGKPLGDLEYITELSFTKQTREDTVHSFGRKIENLTKKAYPNMDKKSLNSVMISSFLQGLLQNDIRSRIQDFIKHNTTAAAGVTTMPSFEKVLDESRQLVRHWKSDNKIKNEVSFVQAIDPLVGEKLEYKGNNSTDIRSSMEEHLEDIFQDITLEDGSPIVQHLRFKKSNVNTSKFKLKTMKSNTDSDIECWSCYEYGHVSANCPNIKPECGRCKSNSHKWQDCKVPNRVLREKVQKLGNEKA